LQAIYVINIEDISAIKLSTGKYIKIINMSIKRSISCESENEQYFQEYPEENNISINILNDDCLEHVFKFLPIYDRVRSEKGIRHFIYIYIYILRLSQSSQDI